MDSVISGGSINVAGPFDMGAGHINPLRALDPGPIYVIKPIHHFPMQTRLSITWQLKHPTLSIILSNIDHVCCDHQKYS